MKPFFLFLFLLGLISCSNNASINQENPVAEQAVVAEENTKDSPGDKTIEIKIGGQSLPVVKDPVFSLSLQRTPTTFSTLADSLQYYARFKSEQLFIKSTYEITKTNNGQYFLLYDHETNRAEVRDQEGQVLVSDHLSEVYSQENGERILPLEDGSGFLKYAADTRALQIFKIKDRKLVLDGEIKLDPTFNNRNAIFLEESGNAIYVYYSNRIEKNTRIEKYGVDKRNKIWEKELPGVFTSAMDVSPGGNFFTIINAKSFLVFDAQLTLLSTFNIAGTGYFTPAYFEQGEEKKVVYHDRDKIFIYDGKKDKQQEISLGENTSIADVHFLNANQIAFGAHRWNTGNTFSKDTKISQSWLLSMQLENPSKVSLVQEGLGFLNFAQVDGSDQLISLLNGTADQIYKLNK